MIAKGNSRVQTALHKLALRCCCASYMHVGFIEVLSLSFYYSKGLIEIHTREFRLLSNVSTSFDARWGICCLAAELK
jgi:hypothetical protein